MGPILGGDQTIQFFLWYFKGISRFNNALFGLVI